MAYPVFLYIAYAGNVSVYITCGLIYYHFYEIRATESYED